MRVVAVKVRCPLPGRSVKPA